MGVTCCRRGTMACRCVACPGARPPTLVLPPMALSAEAPQTLPKKAHSKMKVLRTIKKKMGLASRSCGGVNVGGGVVGAAPGAAVGGAPANNAPPLTFHATHGDNVRVSRDGSTARRVESFCKGVAFSARPVAINEKVCIRFAEISNNWSGVIRFGFTTNDPSTLENALPKYACPDLTNKPGYWAKALNERFCEKDNILHYFVTPSGDVHFGVNGEDKGVFFGGVETRSNLWCLVDVYGNCTAVQFLDPRSQVNGQVIRRNNLQQNIISCDSRRSMSPEAAEERLSASMRLLSMDEPSPPLRYQQPGMWLPMPLHRVKGRNVRLVSDRGIALRNDTEFCQGYVFTARPLLPGEKLVVQVLSTEPMYVGSLALGLTSCDPSSLRPMDLPDDADLLLDRPEYWVVSKDAAGGPRRYDELGFCVTPSGEVRVSKNGGLPATVMHVDHTLRLWAFVDVYGSTQKVRIMSCLPPQTAPSSPAQPRLTMEAPMPQMTQATAVSTPLVSVAGGDGLVQLQPAANGGTVLVVNLPPPPPPHQQNQANHQQTASAHYVEQLSAASYAIQTNAQTQPMPQQAQIWSQMQSQIIPPSMVLPGTSSGTLQLNAGTDCTICYENPIDSVLYMCGHMCMCYRCAVQQWKGKGGGQCPLCRAHIRDVIRTYKS